MNIYDQFFDPFEETTVAEVDDFDNTWGYNAKALYRDFRKNQKHIEQAPGDEVRWGTSTPFSLHVTSATTFTTTPIQLIQSQRNARVWSVQCAFSLNAAGIRMTDQLKVVFKILCNVGSSQVPVYQLLDSGVGGANFFVFPGDQPSMSVTVPNLPAVQILVIASAIYTSGAAGVFDVSGVLLAGLSPVTRPG